MRRLLAIGCVLGACAGEPPAPPAPEVAPRGPQTLPDVTDEDARLVVLLDPGAEPRRRLRYRPRAGARHELALTSRVEMAMSSAGHRMFGTTGSTQIRLALTPRPAVADRITYALEVLELKVPSYDPLHRDAQPDLAGETGTFVATDRGLILEQHLPFRDAAPEVRSELQLEDLLYALPEEPVGVGARWEVRMVTIRNGMTMQLLETHELVELDDAGAVTRFAQRFTGPPQLVPELAQHPLNVFELVAMTSQGAGELHLAFDRPAPTRVALTFEIEAHMRVRRPELVQDVTMTMAVEHRCALD